MEGETTGLAAGGVQAHLLLAVALGVEPEAVEEVVVEGVVEGVGWEGTVAEVAGALPVMKLPQGNGKLMVEEEEEEACSLPCTPRLHRWVVHREGGQW